MASINFNWPSVTAQRNMAATQTAFHTSVERLSSGLRINSAADDAAGLFISEKLQNQVRGLNQATRNAQDGISLVQTAEGALNVTHSILQRMRELAVQSSNGVLTSADRQAISDETKQLLDEVTRVAQSTQFNTLNLLDGKLGGAQVTGLGQVTVPPSAGGSGTASGVVDANGVLLSAATAVNVPGTDIQSIYGIDNVNANSVVANVNAPAGQLANTPVAYQIDVSAVGTDITGAAAAADSVQVRLSQLDPATGAEIAANQQVITVNNVSTIQGSQLVHFGNFDIDVMVNSKLGTDGAGNAQALGNGQPVSNTGFAVSNNLKLVSPNTTTYSAGPPIVPAVANTSSNLPAGVNGLVLQVGADNVSADQMTMMNLNAMTAQALGLEGDSNTGSTWDISQNMLTQSGAQEAIDIIDNAVSLVSNERGKLGAFQNRLQYTITNLGVAAENQAAANSQIQDADVATEVSNMVKNQILAQAGSAVLAQANQQPTMLLSLLR
jgi:flagellin